jgi:hypothetical protein
MTEISATPMEVTETNTDHYLIDTQSSRFTLQAVATGLLSAMGHNPTIGIRDLSGRINFTPKKLEANTLTIIPKPSSFQLGGRIHRQRSSLDGAPYASRGSGECQVSRNPLCGPHCLDCQDGRYTPCGNTQRQLDVARRLAQSDDQRTAGRVVKVYPTCVWKLLAKPDRLRHQGGFCHRRCVETERRVGVFLRDCGPEAGMKTFTINTG